MNYYREINRYLIHGAIWMALIFLYSFPSLNASWGSGNGMRWVLVRNVLYGFINFNLFYCLVFAVLAYPVKRRKYGLALLLAFSMIFIFGVLKYLAGKYFFPDIILQKMIALIGMPKSYFTFWEYMRQAIKTGLGVGLLAFGYHLYLYYRNKQSGEEDIAEELQLANFRFKRMQKGSRFLLHHINELSPVLEDDRRRIEAGSEAILLLSELLRYNLYEKITADMTVDINKELYYFQQYLSLKKILHPEQTLHLQVLGETAGLKLEPMHLQYSVEERLPAFRQYQGDLDVILKCHGNRVGINILQTQAPGILLEMKSGLLHD
ncbi:hypothetical protein COR50_14815 [Chitinophaga caeni]|uniref:Signal transduction histidine kinase internal region domain-containing protein n=2 Tax=Chitinophaga caeni TaxID=2029983 RepID=A0A291QWU8_9BACT|nr:hypothetical protein COR50_14815 [Chitinophaga caeni]